MIKSSFISFLTLLLSASLIVSCKDSDDSKLFRIYTEGKIIPGQNNILEEYIHLNNNSRIIGQAIPKANGEFVVAGPYESGETELKFVYKIKSINTSNNQFKISPDSLSIIIPAGVTYVSFGEIKFK